MEKVYHHPSSGEEASKILKFLLPHPLPLYNRINFHHRSPASHILATFPVSASSPPTCFAIAFIDRSRRPETECWFFISGEIPGRCSGATCVACKSALLAVVHEISTLDTPESTHDIGNMVDANPLLSHLRDPNIMLVGAINEIPKTMLQDEGILALEHPGAEIAYMKYLFQPSTLPQAKALPADLQWGAVRSEDFALVRSRTQIPRQDATLALLPSLALIPVEAGSEEQKAPIAWAFLGPDGSLTSLHTEEEYRGRGWAKVLTGKILTEGGIGGSQKPEDGSERWFHADVALNNASSRAVCRSLGGRESWVVFWVRVNLAKARQLA